MSRFVWPTVLGCAVFLAPLSAQDLATLPPRAPFTPGLLGTRPTPVPGGFGYPALDVDRRMVLELLSQGSFDELDRFFENLDAATDADIRREDELVAAYDVFFGPDRGIGPRLDQWVEYSGFRSEASLIARAQFRRARAWEARGEQRLTDADGARVDRMNEHLRAGLDDLARASGIDRRNLAVFSTVLALVYPWGWSANAQEVLEAGLASYPASHWLRYRALAGMTPRWGGSYEAMQRVVDEAQGRAGENPRLRALRGAVTLDRANELTYERRHGEALAMVEEARTDDIDWTFYFQRGRTLFMAGDYVGALADLDEAVARRPVSARILEYRGRALARIAERLAPPERRAEFFAYAETDLREAVALQQADSALSEWSTWATEAKAACEKAPTRCVQPRDASGSPQVFEPETWLGRVALFVISVPLTLFLVLAEADRLYLLPAPILAALSFVWNFIAWRRQRYWTPRIIPAMSLLGFLLLVWINMNWVSLGGGMWTQRFVVITVSALVPYAVYLVMGGPRYMARVGRAPKP